MAKKRKDDFNQIPDPISNQKPGDSLSQGRKRIIPAIPGDACSTSIPKITNLNIVNKRGRSSGEIIIYDAESTYNYLSQSQRYDRSIDLIPAYVRENGNTTIYGFCSHNSPKGFWEVTVSSGGLASYIKITPKVIVILCPRPFLLSELVTIESDTSSYKFTQIAGNRTVLIEPDNTQYPLITIQSTCFTSGCDSNSSSPLIIRVETDNELVFDDLVILNRAIELWDGLGFLGVVETEIEACKVATFYRVPDSLQTASLWIGSPLGITWLSPKQDAEYITDFVLQRLAPPYADIENISALEPRLFHLDPNQRYKVLADFDVLGNKFSSFSDPVFFRYPVPDTKVIFADDSCSTLGFNLLLSNTTVTDFGVQSFVLDEYAKALGFASIGNTTTTIEIGSKLIQSSDDFIGLGFTNLKSDYSKLDLGGVIIG